MANASVSQTWPIGTPVRRCEFVRIVEHMKLRFLETHGTWPQNLDLPRAIAFEMLKWDRNEWGGDIAGELFSKGIEAFPDRLLGLAVRLVDGDELRVY